MTQAQYEPYPDYRDSKVAWLRGMPQHWDLLKTKRIFSRVQRPVRSEDGIVTAFRDGEVTLRSNRRVDGFTNAVKEIGYQGVRQGDLLVHAMDGFAGAIGVSDSDGKCSPVCSVCVPLRREQLDVTYYGYLVRQLAVTDFITSLAKGIRERSTEFRFSEFTNLPLAVPPKAEQTQIAKFLDYETAKMDALIEKQQQLIALLKEKRQAVISHAVTQGLNPDAPMRDSGVEWLGEVPAHWEVKKLKHLQTLNPSKKDARLDQSLLCTFLPMEQLKTGSADATKTASIKDVFDGYNYFQDSDILMAKVTPCFENKNIAIAQGLRNGVGFGSTEIYVLRPFDHVDRRFLFYRLQEALFLRMGAGAMTGAGGLRRVPSDFLQNYSIALPPLDEQRRIAAYTEARESSFDQLSALAEGGVSLLRERRTALISAAVTGKIDVRGWKAPKTAVEAETA